MALQYILSFSLIGLASALLRRASQPEQEPVIEEVDWSALPDDVYLSDALLERIGGRA